MASSREEPAPLAVGLFGMRLFLASLAMLFGATIVGYLVVRFKAPTWPPPGSPPLPAGLFVATALLLLSGVAIQGSLITISRGKEGAFRVTIVAATLLGFGFLIMQVFNWQALVARGLVPQKDLFAFTFYFLTFLHALHVLGGLLPLVTVSVRAFQGRYTKDSHSGVRYLAMYWHFLLAVWIVILLLLRL